MEPAIAQGALEQATALQPERFVLELLFASLRTGAALALLPALGGQLRGKRLHFLRRSIDRSGDE